MATKINFNQIKGAAANVLDYGASASNTAAQNTTAFQAALASGAANIYIPAGVYQLNTLTVATTVCFFGDYSRDMTSYLPAPIAIGNMPNVAILVQNDATNPLFNLVSATRPQFAVEGLVFWQTHASYTAPTVWPYVISAANSSSFWTQITVENCHFPNCYDAINLPTGKGYKFYINNVTGDFFHNFITAVAMRDLCTITNVEAWPYATGALNTFTLDSTKSTYLIALDDVDSMFIDNVFMYGRSKGMSLTAVWGQVSHIDYDVVAYCFYILNPKRSGLHISNINMECEGYNATIASPIDIDDNDGTDTGRSIFLKDISSWKGTAIAGMAGAPTSYGYTSLIRAGAARTTFIVDGIYDFSTAAQTIYIASARKITISNVAQDTTYSGYDQSVVVIRNEAVTDATGANLAQVVLGSGITGRCPVLFDGYAQNVTFPRKKNVLHGLTYLQVGSGQSIGTPAVESTGNSYVVVTDTYAASDSFAGARFLPPYCETFISTTPYIAGVYYRVSAAVNTFSTDHRLISLPTSAATTNNIYVPLNISTFQRQRLTIMQTGIIDNNPGVGAPVVSDYALRWNGAITFYKMFICKSHDLCAEDDPSLVFAATIPPTSTASYFRQGTALMNPAAASAGSPGSVCTTAGNPGTWKAMANLA